MIVTRSATSVLEVEPELQGSLILALDPLSLSPGVRGLATSSFAVWRRLPASEDSEDGWSKMSPSLLSKLLTYFPIPEQGVESTATAA